MPSFEEKVDEIEKTQLPVVEGFAVKLAAGEDPEQVRAKLPGDWKPAPGGGWLVQRIPAGAPSPALGEAWEHVRRLQAIPVEQAEPLFSLACASCPRPRRAAFSAPGAGFPEARRQEIAVASRRPHWALEQLRCPAAWAAWAAKHGAAAPGHGVLIAQLDTGYTPNPRVLLSSSAMASCRSASISWATMRRTAAPAPSIRCRASSRWFDIPATAPGSPA